MPQSKLEIQPSTCADCPYYQSRQDGTNKGWCNLFNVFARENHATTQDLSNLTVFQFESQEVRFVGTADDPWWMAADVCAALDHSNPSSAIARLDDDEKKLLDPKQYLGSFSNQDFWAINESGLYSLILTSRKPQAKRFKKWITSEVLPSIRKTGSYAMPSAVREATIAQPTAQPQLLPTPTEISEVIDLMLGKTDLHPNLIAGAKGSAIAQLHPQLLPVIESAKTLLPIPVKAELVRPTALAERLTETTGQKWSAIRVNKMLIEQGFQIKNPDDGKDPAYLPTEKGKEHCQLVVETAKGHGKTIQSLQWHLSVLEALEANDH